MGLLVSSLWRRLFTYREFKICLVGLDNAGKTTILFQLHMGEVVDTQPTIGSNVEEVVHKNVHFNVWDLGGQETSRQGWSTYFLGTHAVIVVVDSTDRQRIPDVKRELFKILESQDLSHAVLLVFANKQDQLLAHTTHPTHATASSIPPPRASCMTAAEIAEELNLQSIKTHPWHIQSCCAITGEGLYEGIDWVTQAVAK